MVILHAINHLLFQGDPVPRFSWRVLMSLIYLGHMVTSSMPAVKSTITIHQVSMRSRTSVGKTDNGATAG